MNKPHGGLVSSTLAQTSQPIRTVAAEIPTGDLNVKNVMIRGVFAALSLTFGVVQMAHAAADSAPQKPIAGQQTAQSTTSVPAHGIYADQSSMAIGAVDHVGNMSPSPSTHKGTIQSGNDFNWLGGGGG